ncbi:Phospholipid-translocating_ATPase [Hexamita inflata]|uniref:Phospholipid-translocating ATPase n=1 Tax=Hexamita inflata TaxID=28002 RepID=A0AA86QYL7_9EUKA|nr:Phospholipid-translocating ATPase [Hexamita inflata]
MQQGLIVKTLNEIDVKTARDNFIRTSKYTWYSFIPLFLFEQYKQMNNIYYLLNAIAGYIVIVVTPITNVLPIIFVLFMAAIREIIEDASRHKSDAQQNATQYNIIRNTSPIKVQSRDIREGDIILVKQKQEIPCDCLVLESSLESGVCYVSTANLDGEVNLKPKVQILDKNYFKNPQNIDSKNLIVRENLGGYKNFKAKVSTPPPEDNMQSFIGSIILNNEQKNFNLNNVLLRGSRLENTETALCGVIFAGKNTRLMQTQIKARVKSSRMNIRMNKLVVYQAFLSIIIMLVFPGVSAATYNSFSTDYVSFQMEPSSAAKTFAEKVIIYFVLLAYLLPVSLFVSIEMTRLVNSVQMEADKNLQRTDVRNFLQKDPKNQIKNSSFANENVYAISVQSKNSICIENLQEVDIIFSDKTGTLTKNQMIFHSFANDQNVQREVIFKIKAEMQQNFRNHNKYENFDLKMLFQLALCNTVQTQMVKIDGNETQVYQGESPDEIAFCYASKVYGLKLHQRNASSVEYQLNINEHLFNMTFNVLAVVPFSSDRKKMSIVLQEVGENIPREQLGQLNNIITTHNNMAYFLPKSIAQAGQPFVLTKGADSFMLPLCNITKENNDAIQKIASEYSMIGLRTLVFGSKQLNDPEWVKQWNLVSNLKESDPQYFDCTKQIETNLAYSGMTAIEDELQDQLHDTLSFTINAGVRVWMLTGDKTETAVNIAKSSGLAPKDTKLLYLTTETASNPIKLNQCLLEYIDLQKQQLTGKALENYETVQKSIKQQSVLSNQSKFQKTMRELLGYFYCRGLNKQIINDSQSGNNTTLVMDSKTYNLIRSEHLENEFYTIAFHSQSAVCCRLSPSEKAQIIKRTHDLIPEFTTLAIGDGANDVAMIKEAQIGIGVAGKEGVHSCNNADITVPEFRFLKQLIFVYGRYTHLRNQELFEYCIEKNSIIALMHVVYSFYNLFSVQVCIDSLLLTMFNLLITFFPIAFQAVIEQDIDREALLEHPRTFRQFSQKFRPSGLFMSLRLCKSLYYSIVIITLNKYLTSNQIIFSNGQVNDLGAQSLSFYFTILCVTSIELFIHQTTFTYYLLGSFIFMIVLVTACVWLGNSSQMFGTTNIGVIMMVQGSLHFHISWIITSLVCVVPSICYQVIRKLYFPNNDDIMRAKYRAEGCKGYQKAQEMKVAQSYTEIIQIAPSVSQI